MAESELLNFMNSGEKEISNNRTETIRYEDGVVYEGEVCDGVPHGRGTITHPYGTTEECIYINGVKQ